MQGADLLRRNFQKHPGRTLLRTTLGITLPSIGLWLFNHSDDDRAKRYDSLPSWRKNFFWNIPIKGGPIVSLPKPFELGIIFGSLPERILDYTYLNDPDALKSAATAVKDGMLPGLIPTAGLAPIENMTNWSFFLERPLESEGLKQLPPGMRAGKYTSEVGKRFGKMTDLSPIKFDNWIKGWTGGLGKTALHLLDPVLQGDVPEVGKAWYEVTPGIKGFISREPIGSMGKDVNRFYENMEKIIQANRGYKVLRQSGNKEDAKQFKINTENIGNYAPGARRVAKGLSNIRKKISIIMESKGISSEEKRKQIDYWNTKMTERAKKFNSRFIIKSKTIPTKKKEPEQFIRKGRKRLNIT